MKKQIAACEKKIFDYEKTKLSLEKEMLEDGFYNSINENRVQKVSSDLKNIMNLISDEEKKWEIITDKIDNNNL